MAARIITDLRSGSGERAAADHRRGYRITGPERWADPPPSPAGYSCGAAPSSDLLDQLHLRAVGRGNPAHMPAMAFLRVLCDENVPRRLINALGIRNLTRAQGIADAGLQGRSDQDVLRWCIREEHCLLTRSIEIFYDESLTGGVLPVFLYPGWQVTSRTYGCPSYSRQTDSEPGSLE
jgi:hypothetical protein